MNIHAGPPAQSTTAMERLLALVRDARPDAAVREHAVRAILDTLAATVAGSIEEPVRRLQASLDPAEGSRAVPSLWSDESHSAGDAALLLGIASHILNYDDVSMNADLMSVDSAALKLEFVMRHGKVAHHSVLRVPICVMGVAMPKSVAEAC